MDLHLSSMSLYLFSNLFAESLPGVLFFWGITYVFLKSTFGRVEVRTTIALFHIAATTAILALVAWPIRGEGYDVGIRQLPPLVLSIISCAILYFQEQRYQKSKQSAVVASTVDCVVESQAQPVLVPMTATQPVQQINKTVVASVIAGVVTVAGCFYLFVVVSANQAYDKAVTEHSQAVAAYETWYAGVKELGWTRYSDSVPDYQPTSCCTDTEDALLKAEIAKRHPFASLFNKADVE